MSGSALSGPGAWPPLSAADPFVSISPADPRGSCRTHRDGTFIMLFGEVTDSSCLLQVTSHPQSLCQSCGQYAVRGGDEGTRPLWALFCLILSCASPNKPETR